MTRTSRVLLGCAIFLCLVLQIRGARAQWTKPDSAFKAACSKLVPHPFAARLELDEPLPRQIATLACVENHNPPSILPRKLGFVQLHFTFDDRRYSHLKAAMIVVSCFANGECAAPKPGRRRRHRYGMLSTGIVHSYARRTDPAKVKRELRVKLPPLITDAFIERFKTAKEEVATLVSQLDVRRRRLYSKIPRQVFERRASHFRQHAALYARFNRLDAKLKGGATDENMLTEALAIRNAYMSQCTRATGVRECLNGPLARPLTEIIVQLAIGLKKAALGFAENDMLARTAGTHTAAMQMYAIQNVAVRKEASDHEKYQRARSKGIPESMLKRKYGDPPPLRISRNLAWRPPDQKVNYKPLLKELDTKVGWDSGIIKALSKRGRWTRIVFETKIGKFHESDCVETNRIDRIDSDGRIHYRTKCKYKRTRIIRTKIRPVLVAAGEGAHLKRGYWVRVAYRSKDRRGHVIEGFSDGRRQTLTNLRGYRERAAGTRTASMSTEPKETHHDDV